MELEKNKVYNMDCLEGMKQLKSDSVDLVVIDPPYNIGIDKWDKIDNYIIFMERVIDEIRRVIKSTGSLYIWNSAKYVAEIKCLCSKKKFLLNSWIVWNKKSKQQNSTRSYADITEHCLFFTLIDSTGLSLVTTPSIYPIRKYIRQEIIRAKGKIILNEINKVLGTATNGGGVASACLSLNKTCPAMVTEEHYLILRKWLNGSSEKEYEFLKKEYESLRKEYESLRYTFNYIDIGKKRNPKDKRTFTKEVTNPINVWEHQNTNELNKISHTTPKPLSLIKKIIKVSSNKNQLVLDCFMGSGTTAVACKQLNRNFIGFEISKEYCEIANKRLEQNNLKDY